MVADTNNSNINNNTTRKAVSFGEVRVREHERILVDQPEVSTYACLAIGWAHRSSIVNSLAEVDDHERPQQSQVVDSDTDDDCCIYSLSSSSGTSATSSSGGSSRSLLCGSGSNHGALPRYTASERVQVLNEYGFDLKEVMGNEQKKKYCAEQQKQQRRQQRKKSSTTRKSRSLSPLPRARGAVKGLMLLCGLSNKKSTTVH